MKRFALLALVSVACPFSFGQFITSGLAYSVVGDGTTALSNAAAQTSVKSISKSGGASQLVATFNNGSTGDRLTNSGTATSEGALTNSLDGQSLTIGGYDAALGTASVAGSTSAAVNRVVGKIDNAGTVTYTKFNDAFSGNNIRSTLTNDGNQFWMGGNGGGGVRYGTTGPTSIVASPTIANNRTLGSFGGDLYLSTGSGTSGIYKISGLPGTTGNAASLVFATGSGSSPYGFWFADANTCYVADDRNTAAGGIQKWTFNGTTWTASYTLGTGAANVGARGLAGEVVAGQNVLYAVTSEGTANRLISITDTGAGSLASTLATADANTVFRGVAFAPVPEPASMAALGAGLAGLVARRRRKQ